MTHSQSLYKTWFSCLLMALVCLAAISSKPIFASTDFWRSATVYFMLTDRFLNGDVSNDQSYGRNSTTGVLRGFEGGDIQGITQKINEGYFNELGVDAIWMTPLIEQVHGYDESGSLTYAYHGYWPKDWTAVDANFGNEQQLAEMIQAAHRRGIRVLFDVIINHTGPVTKEDPAWPSDWIRTRPLCDWSSYEQNTQCALASSLTDIKTETETDIALPKLLTDKWQAEGRLQQELNELDAFFSRTGYPRAPKYYLVKWLTEWVRQYGVDGFRVDTAKHVEPEIWQVLKQESEYAFAQWKANNPRDVLDDQPFYMVGEVYHWGMLGFKNTIAHTLEYDFGDKQVNYFDYGFDALINMGFVEHAKKDSASLFAAYSDYLHSPPMQGKGILSYIGSHDDFDSFDRERRHNFETAFKLMMAPGGVQIYYGDELARPMIVPSAEYDASMRASMNWQDLSKQSTQELLTHWRKLGQFRQQFRAVGAGLHRPITPDASVFSRAMEGYPTVIIGSGLAAGSKTIQVQGVFVDNTMVKDFYSGQGANVQDGKIVIDSPYPYVLLASEE